MVIQDAAYISIVPGGSNHVSNLPRLKPYKIPIVIESNDTHRVNNIIGKYLKYLLIKVSNKSTYNYLNLACDFCFLGKNCSYATESSMPLPLIQPPFSCELNFISSSMDININDIFLCTSGFDLVKGISFSVYYLLVHVICFININMQHVCFYHI